MKLFKMFASVICLAAVCVLVLPRTHSGDRYKRTKPVSITETEPANHLPKAAGSPLGLLMVGVLCSTIGLAVRKFAKRDPVRLASVGGAGFHKLPVDSPETQLRDSRIRDRATSKRGSWETNTPYESPSKSAHKPARREPYKSSAKVA